MEGHSVPEARGATTSYLPNSNTQADSGGGTYSGPGGGAYRQPSIEDYEAIFGPSARDIKQDNGRFKRHQRWHLPDILKGPNEVDGLITDTTQSPFTTSILPYVYLERPDQKIKWNVWSFDEGMASRVPYESAARVLAQSHKSFSGYTVRHGLAITMEHNFMVSPEGRTNFQNQLKQLIGSIQYSNDYDVHTALILAPSYAKTIDEKYYAQDKNVWQRCREYVDLFGIMQKNANALDILIEEAKATLQSWGSQAPTFLLTNSKLTMQMTMTPEKTSYVAHGPDGVKRLAEGPSLPSYRGLNIINSRSFSTEEGARPRDMLNRRVRVAEYYAVMNVPCNRHGMPHNANDYIELYDQSKDQMFKITFKELAEAARLEDDVDVNEGNSYGYSGTARGAGFAREMSTQQYGVLHDVSDNVHDTKYADAIFLQDQMKLFVYYASTGTPWSTSLKNYFEGALVENLQKINCDKVLYTPVNSDYRNVDKTNTDFKNLESWGEWYPYNICQQLPPQDTALSNLRILPLTLNCFKCVIDKDSKMNNQADEQVFTQIFVRCLSYFLKLPELDQLSSGRMESLGFLPQFQFFNKNIPLDKVLPDVTWSDQNTINSHKMLYYILCEPVENLQDIRNKAFIRYILEIKSRWMLLIMYLFLNEQEQNKGFIATATSLWGRAGFALDPTVKVKSLNAYNTKETEMKISDFMSNYFIPFYGNRSATFTDAYSWLSTHEPTKNIQKMQLNSDPNPNQESLKNVFQNLLANVIIVHQVEYMKKNPNQKTDDWKCTISKEDVEQIENQMKVDPAAQQPRPSEATPASASSSSSGTAAGKERELQKQVNDLKKQLEREKTDCETDKIKLRRSIESLKELHSKDKPESSWWDWGGKGEEGDKPQKSLNPYSPSPASSETQYRDFFIVRPCIEHQMLGVVMGRGGKDELGCTFWGQTELSVYDDAMHGKWGMSYKYHERAMVLNERNLIRCWDVAFNGYNGGCDDQIVHWSDNQDVSNFSSSVLDISRPYNGKSIMVMSFVHTGRKPANPLVYQCGVQGDHIDAENIHHVFDPKMELQEESMYNNFKRWNKYSTLMPQFRSNTYGAGQSANDQITETSALAFQGTCRIKRMDRGNTEECCNGSGHLGSSYVGVASVREGKGMFFNPAASNNLLVRPI